MRVTQTFEESQTIFATARNSIRRKDWNFACRRLRTMVLLVTSTKGKTLVGMRTRPTTDLPPMAALLGLVLHQRTAHFLLPHGTNVHDHGQFVQRNRPEVQENGRRHHDITVIRGLIIHKHDL
jgi:hypothetical protein